MIFLGPWSFFLLNCLIVVFHWIKFGVYILLTPIVERVIKSRFKRLGVEINGNDPWDIQIYRKDAYARIGTYYGLGLGEAYMDRTVDVADVAQLTHRLSRSKDFRIMYGYNFMQYFNMQTKSLVWQVGKQHYDIGNKLFEAMLDSNMNYTCGYWRNATNLEEAQLHKMDLIARKLNLKPGMRVLDIGCGFGGLAKYLADNYDVEVVGCTISVEQANYGRERFAHPKVEIRLVDYRDITEEFDRIVSVGMFEHVGEANYTTFFSNAKRCLKDDGIFLLHTIAVCDKDFPTTDNFNQKYVFCNGVIPRQRLITKYIDGHFYIEDWHNFGHDYTKTLAAWLSNFKKAWPELEADYDDSFYRMWTFYLMAARGFFLSRKFNLFQIVLSKNGLEGGYLSVR